HAADHVADPARADLRVTADAMAHATETAGRRGSGAHPAEGADIQGTQWTRIAQPGEFRLRLRPLSGSQFRSSEPKGRDRTDGRTASNWRGCWLSWMTVIRWS